MIDVFGSVDVFIQEYRWAVRGGVHAMYERGEHVCGVEALNSSPLKDTSGWMPVLKVFPSPPAHPPLALDALSLSCALYIRRSVLGSQLLTCSDYECEGAIRVMELLKLRFGEPALHACEV